MTASGPTHRSSDPVPGFDDVTDADLRARADLNWAIAPDGVLPAWVAEMDYAPCPAVVHAVDDAVRVGRFGYPSPAAAARLRWATAEFARDRYGWPLDPDLVVPTGDVMAGVMIAIETLCAPGPVVVPTPAYPPFLQAIPATGRRLVPVPLDPDADSGRARPGPDRGGAGRRRPHGAAVQPAQPVGPGLVTPDELAGLRDVVVRHGARVVSDEIHAPLSLPGGRHTPYASIEGTADHVTTVLSASKAFNLPGLKCAQLVAGTPADARALAGLPPVANHGLSPLGLEANVAAYAEGGPWLDTALAHLAGNRDLFAELLAEHLPLARIRRLEATYLAWVDLRAYAVPDDAGRRRPRARPGDGPRRQRLRARRGGPRAGQHRDVAATGSSSWSAGWARPSTRPPERTPRRRRPAAPGRPGRPGRCRGRPVRGRR